MNRLNVVYEHHNGTDKLEWPNGFSKNITDDFIDKNSFNTVMNNGAFFLPNGYYYGWFFTKAAHDRSKIRYSNIFNNERYIFPVLTNYLLWIEMRKKPLYIPEQVVNDIRNKKAKVVLLVTEADLVQQDKVEGIKKTVEKYSISYEDIIYISSNYIQSKLLKAVGVKEMYFNIWQYNYNGCHVQRHIDEIRNSIINKQIRNKKFLCLNRVPREHRLFIVNYFLEKQLDSDTILTLPDGHVGIVEKVIPGVPLPKQAFTEQELKPYPHLKGRLPLNYDFKDSRDFIHETNRLSPEAHKQAYFNIVTETVCDSDTERLCFTEKTFKPIMCMQPFVLISTFGSLKALKEMGYKTFEGFIDESYDQEIDTNLRLEKITKTINEINSMSYNELADMLYKMLPILEHNYKNYNDSLECNLVDISMLINTLNSIW
jgi:hypothetical protein